MSLFFKASAQIGSFKPLVPLQGEDYFTKLHLSEDGAILTSIDQAGNLKKWDTRSFKLLGNQKEWKHAVFSYDGSVHTSRNTEGLLTIVHDYSLEENIYELEKQLSDRLMIQFFTPNNQLIIISYSGEILKFESNGKLVAEYTIGKKLYDCYYLEKETGKLILVDESRIFYMLDVDSLELSELGVLRGSGDILHFHINSTLDSLYILSEGKVQVCRIGKNKLTLMTSEVIDSSIKFIWSDAVKKIGEILFCVDEYLLRLEALSGLIDTIYQCPDFCFISNLVLDKQSELIYFTSEHDIFQINLETKIVSRFEMVTLVDVQNKGEASLSEFFIDSVWPSEIDQNLISKKTHAIFLSHIQKNRKVYISEDPDINWYWSSKPDKSEVDAFIKLPALDEIMEVYKDESNQHYVLLGFENAYIYSILTKQLSIFQNSSLVLPDNFYFLNENKEVVFKSLYDSILSFFEVETGNLIDSIRFKSDIVSIDLLKDQSELAVLLDDGNLRIIDSENRSIKKEINFGLIDLSYSSVRDLTFVSSDLILLKFSNSHYRLLNSTRSSEFLEFFYFGKDWIVKLANSPIFMGTPNASKLINYTNNRDSLLSFEQLDLIYNRPDIVLDSIKRFFGTSKQLEAQLALFRQVVQKRWDHFGIYKPDDFEVYAHDFPTLKLDRSIQHNNTSGEVSIGVSSSSNSLISFNAFVNEVPIFGTKGITLGAVSAQFQFDSLIVFPLSVGRNKIEFSVRNELGFENLRYPQYVTYFPKDSIKEKTYFIGIGVNEFADQGHDLTYCVKDINDLAEKFVVNYSADTILFKNSEVTRENILGIREWLMNNTTIHDKVIISCNSHGLLDSLNQFYLATSDVDFEKPWERGISYSELEWLLDSIPARKKLLLIDACNSGENEKTKRLEQELIEIEIDNDLIAARGSIKKEVQSNVSTFQKMTEIFVNVRNNTGSNIIAAAGGNQSALEGVIVEGKRVENGAFSYAILEYLNEHPESVSINELKKYVEARVEEITQGEQKPVSRQETFEYDWKLN